MQQPFEGLLLKNDVQADKFPTMEVLFGCKVDVDLEDGTARYQAINPFESFIIQAPAGSGKTTLLTQRFLALLSQVEQPEQIIAMTFTKKGASEMRDRIMGALKEGLLQTLPEGANVNDFNTWKLAKKVLQRDAEKCWLLLQNPNRLRIRTIDGLNSYLVGQMPLLSKMGVQSQISHDVNEAYQEAVYLTLKTPELKAAVVRLLGLVNGCFTRAEALLINMLKKRDQWMGCLLGFTGDEARAGLEYVLKTIIEDELKRQVAQLSHVGLLLEKACEIAKYACQNNQPQLAILRDVWPLKSGLKDQQAWQVLADWLLTKDSKNLRKKVTKNEGFPVEKGASKAHKKEQFVELLTELREELHSQEVVQALSILKNLPEPHYSDEQWDDLQGLIELLRVASAYLKVVFQSTGQTDFIEIAQAASQALGSELEPTDLAQQLDYQVKHLLVDEFQDTSVEQFSLIRKLIAGWQQMDRRTLFIVGDPMQSIYRFREAEVGNFLKVWQGQVGNISLTPLNLTVNFRSTQGVVNWVNRHFKQILPKDNNIEKGAVTYSHSIAFSTDDSPAVEANWAINRSHEAEAETIVNLVRLRLSQFLESDTKSIAILGRSRSSLIEIALRLKRAKIRFRAVDLEILSERQEIQDVQALSRALLHLADRPAWIALLRSPMVGLSLNDLYAVMGDQPYQLVWQCLLELQDKDNKTQRTIATPQVWCAPDLAIEKKLSREGQRRLNQVLPILQQSMSRLGSLPFSTLIREVWLQLDGPQTVESMLALENLEVFFHTLAEFDGEALDFTVLEKMMDALFARADSSDESRRIELMTIHKSKGLEFDSVILPGLGRKPRGYDSELVSWFTFLADDATEGLEDQAHEQLVIVPMTQKGQGVSRLSQLLKRFELEKQNYELGRLLYVAATRAKYKLYLFGEVALKQTNNVEIEIKPAKKSILETLWPCIRHDFTCLAKEHEFVEDLQKTCILYDPPKVCRLPVKRADFKAVFGMAFTDHIAVLSAEKAALEPSQSLKNKVSKLAKDSVDSVNPQQALLNTTVGNLVHAVLEQMVSENLTEWNAERLQQRLPFYHKWLVQHGLKESDLSEGMRRVEKSLKHVIHNKKLIWSLNSEFTESATEQEFSSIELEGEVYNYIIDRTFIDDSGTRWIIDYKTSVYNGSDLPSFITHQVAHYQPQLKHYGKLFSAVEERPQKWVLYFSYIDRWIELN